MHRKTHTPLAALLCSILMAGAGMAAEQNNGIEAKLREALKNTMLQLRDVQTQLATLQGTQAELEDRDKSLDAKLKALTKQADSDKLESDKTIAAMKAAITAKDLEIAQLRDVVGKAKVAIEQRDRLQAATEEKRKLFEEKSILLQRRVEDQQRKNAAMYQLGLEVVGRYEKFGLGDAISAREPFIGATRVKFENLVQDYTDKLTEQKIKPEAAADRVDSGNAAATTKPKTKGRESSKSNTKTPNNDARPRD